MKTKAALLILILGLGFLWGFVLRKDDPSEAFLRKIPVQSGGRVKPFESFAREALLSVTGKSSLEGKSATTVIWKWIASPDAWYTKSFLPVKFPPLRNELSIKVIGGKISPELVLTDPTFVEKAGKAIARQDKKELLLPIEKKRIELFDRAQLFQAIAQGTLPGLLPDPKDPRAGWAPLGSFASPEERAFLEAAYSSEGLAELQTALGELVKGNSTEAAQKFSLSLSRLLESRNVAIDSLRIRAELLYNQVHPFQGASVAYLISALLWFFLRNRPLQLPFGIFLAAFSFHTLGFALRCFLAGRPPVTNMYESVIWVAWGVVAFSLVLNCFYRNSLVTASAAWVAAFTLLIGESFPAVLDPSLSPLVPVLRNNYWLTVHVLTITLSYAAFALAWGLAHANLVNFAFRPTKKETQKRLSEFVYRALQIGVILLTAGTILGGVWANDSWGRFWGWDPKETWALIALLGYMIVLHGRSANWLGDFGTSLGSVIAFLGILMAWYGVNFVLGAGLHSYGFGGGGLAYIFAVILLDLLLVSYLAFCYNRARRLVLS